MGAGKIKTLRRVVKKQQGKIVTGYMRDHWDTVVRSSISLMRTFKFSVRLRLAVAILFYRRKKDVEEQGAAAAPAKG
jgi:hypothetical protein